MFRVSVVIPCYNAERFLRETLESVFAQSFQDFEIIVIDDGSTDGSRRIIEQFGSRIRAVFGPNRGASVARNAGTELAGGEFIQYLDSDDLLAPHALASRYHALQHSGADVAYSDWQRLVENTSSGAFVAGEVVTRNIESVHRDPVLATITRFWSPPAALLYRRSIVERIGGWNTRLPVIQDARFLQDAALCGASFVHVPGISAYYRTHEGPSLSRRDSSAFLQDCFANALEIEQLLRTRGAFTIEHREALIEVLGSVIRSTYSLDRRLFGRIFQELRRLEPGWHPSSPRTMAWLSRLVGYPNAEAVALAYRNWKMRASLVATHSQVRAQRQV